MTDFVAAEKAKSPSGFVLYCAYQQPVSYVIRWRVAQRNAPQNLHALQPFAGCSATAPTKHYISYPSAKLHDLHSSPSPPAYVVLHLPPVHTRLVLNWHHRDATGRAAFAKLCLSSVHSATANPQLFVDFWKITQAFSYTKRIAGTVCRNLVGGSVSAWERWEKTEFVCDRLPTDESWKAQAAEVA